MMGKQGQEELRTSIKRRVILFSLILFSLIFISGSIVFMIAMHQNVRLTTGHELTKAIEIEKIKLEASVNGEIALALKMATSPLIIQHFLTPSDPVLKRYAFNEIEGYRKAFASEMVFWASDSDKEFYFSEDNHYTVDTENPNNYWYKMTLYETERYNFNINYNPEIKKTMLWINATVFDLSRPSQLGIGRGTPIGLVGTGIDLTEFVNSIYKSYKNLGSLYLFNDSGEFTGAKDASLISDKKNINNVLGETGKKIFSTAKSIQGGGFQDFEADEGVVAVGEVPALGWYIAAIQPIGISAILGSSMTFLFLAMLAVVAGIFLIFYMYIAQILKPMKYMVETLDHISLDWDLTQRLHFHRRDEIGTLGDFFNQTFEKIKNLIADIKEKTIFLTNTGDELTKNMVITKKDIDGINSSIQHMREQILKQSDKVNSTVNSIERILNGMEALNGHINVQANSVAQSSSAIEEMLANISSVTQTLVRNTANINSLAQTSDAGRLDIQTVSTDIQEIAHESEGLLQINSVMQTIASQTNLLAMNAAIEAAHAGESGKGFAVVADEIRKLAENSGKQSKTISGVLKKIKTMIDAITKSTSVVQERFQAIEREVRTVSEQETQIRNAMEEQGTGSRQILEAVNQLNNITSQVRQSSSDMTSESKEVLGQSSELKRITEEVANDVDEMTQNADEIYSAFSRVQDITAANNNNISAINTGIKQFKVE